MIKKIKAQYFGLCLMVAPYWANASTTQSDLPWEDTLSTISNSISGPVLLSISTIMFIVTLLMAAFGEWGDIFKIVIKSTMVISLCFGITAFINTLFTSGAVF
jgi:type IV secretion system protein TrbC